MESSLKLRIVLEKPPKGVDFGLQTGRGSAYETIQTQRSKGQDLVFAFTLGLTAGSKASTPVLNGPYVQGPPAQRFVYLDIGTYAGQKDSCWSRRLKIPLSGITMAMIRSQAVLEARIPGTGKDGEPSCATVHPVGGWKVVSD